MPGAFVYTYSLEIGMKPSDAFGVALKAMGVWVIVQLILNVPASIAGLLSTAGMLAIVLQVMLGYSLIFRSDLIVRLVYPRKPFEELAELVSRGNQNDS